MLSARNARVAAITCGFLIFGQTANAVGQTINAPASTIPGSAPGSAIGTPMTPLAPLAPLSPQVVATPLSGGTVRTDRLASPTAITDSPSEQALSTAGGGGKTLQDCMNFWDRETHMSKSEWRGACERSLHRLDHLKIDGLTVGIAKARH